SPLTRLTLACLRQSSLGDLSPMGARWGLLPCLVSFAELQPLTPRPHTWGRGRRVFEAGEGDGPKQHQTRKLLTQQAYHSFASSTPPWSGTSHGSAASRSSRSIRQSSSSAGGSAALGPLWFIRPSKADQRNSASRLYGDGDSPSFKSQIGSSPN